MSLRIIDEIKTRERLYKRYKRSLINGETGETDRICSDKLTYQNQQKKVKLMIIKAKKDYLSNKIQEANGDTRKIWQVIKNRLGSTSKKQVSGKS